MGSRSSKKAKMSKTSKLQYERISWEDLILEYGMCSKDIDAFRSVKPILPQESDELGRVIHDLNENINAFYNAEGEIPEIVKYNRNFYLEKIGIRMDWYPEYFDKLKYLMGMYTSYRNNETKLEPEKVKKLENLLLDVGKNRPRENPISVGINPESKDKIDFWALEDVLEDIKQQKARRFKSRQDTPEDKKVLTRRQELKLEFYKRHPKVDWVHAMSNAKEKILEAIPDESAQKRYYQVLNELFKSKSKIGAMLFGMLSPDMAFNGLNDFCDLSSENIYRNAHVMDTSKVLEESMRGSLKSLDIFYSNIGLFSASMIGEYTAREEMQRQAKTLVTLPALLDAEKDYVRRNSNKEENSRLDVVIKDCEDKLKKKEYLPIISDMYKYGGVFTNTQLEALYDNGMMNLSALKIMTKDWDPKDIIELLMKTLSSVEKTDEFYKAVNELGCAEYLGLKTQSQQTGKIGGRKIKGTSVDKEAIDVRAKYGLIGALYDEYSIEDLPNGYRKFTIEEKFPGTDSRIVFVEPIWDEKRGKLVPVRNRAGATCSEEYYNAHKADFDNITTGTLLDLKTTCPSPEFIYETHHASWGKDKKEFAKGVKEAKGSKYTEEQTREIDEYIERINTQKVTIRSGNSGR